MSRQELMSEDVSDFNESAYSLYFGGEGVPKSADIYEKCVERVFSCLPDRLQTLEEAISLEKRKVIIEVSHQLKGGFKTIGAEKLGRFFLDLEKNASEMSRDEMVTKVIEIKSALIPLQDRIKTFLESLKRGQVKKT